MDRATMPETSIHEYGDARVDKHKICTGARCHPTLQAETQAKCMKCNAQAQFGCRIA